MPRGLDHRHRMRREALGEFMPQSRNLAMLDGPERQTNLFFLEISGFHGDEIVARREATEAVVPGFARGGGACDSSIHVVQLDGSRVGGRPSWIGNNALNVAAELSVAVDARKGEYGEKTCNT